MGNIGSHSGHNITQNHHRSVPEEQWAHSFPRTQPVQQRFYQQNKVLPERDSRQKLRHTNNGEILQSGGTLSGRQQPSRLSVRSNNETMVEVPLGNEKSSSRTYLPNQRDPLHKSGSRYQNQAIDYKHFQNGFNHNAYREKMKRFGSEPDLRQQTRNTSSDSNKGIMYKINNRSKKKYKAPPPPSNNNQIVDGSHNSLDWEENSSGDNGAPSRRARLFKTRAETKKTYSSPVHNHKSLDDDAVQMRGKEYSPDLRLNRLSLPEITTTASSEFHQELKEATKRLRNTRPSETPGKEKLKTLDHNIHKKENIRQKLKEIEAAAVVEDKKMTNKKMSELVRGDGSGKESSSPECSSPGVMIRSKEQVKTFYFGMEDKITDDYSNDVIDHFASNLHSIGHVPKIHSSESDLSSEIEADETHGSRNGIDLQLRPILPKKQLEIPRFSPAAAWRLLSAVDSNAAASTIASDDVPVFIEDKIEKFARPPPPNIQIGQRSINDKSGDSGISGDAGPGGYDDGVEAIMNSRNSLQMSRPNGVSWTPQQDLGDDSSMEEGLNETYKPRPKFTNGKPHVFSLSLPRDNHLSAYMGDKSTYTGLQKLKRSVSGVLGTLGSKKDLVQPNLSQADPSDNWFLSKSAPNSLNNGFNSLEMKNSDKSDEKESLLVPNNSKRGRLMYLPEFNNQDQHHRSGRTKNKDDLIKERSRSVERSRNIQTVTHLSKSCENISGEIRYSSEPEPEDLQDPPKPIEDARVWTRKPKRFTFQSTVRQIERRRLAEKLSREAEKKEKQRLRELEAMQKVEEEFQKKRAREKATIRQQLRLFSLDDLAWSSLPQNLDSKDDVRQEPDGAVSSSPTSSPSLPPLKNTPVKKVYQKNKKVFSPSNIHPKHRPSSESSEDTRIKAQVTQVLSEYRHPQREYKDYTGSTRYLNDVNEAHAKTTVHPQVTCKMPKAKQGLSNNKTNGTNYRKDFAHGVKSTRSAGSTYSEDSQSRNNSPRMYHNKYAPITRF